jgi:hypothetical protein
MDRMKPMTMLTMSCRWRTNDKMAAGGRNGTPQDARWTSSIGRVFFGAAFDTSTRFTERVCADAEHCTPGFFYFIGGGRSERRANCLTGRAPGLASDCRLWWQQASIAVDSSSVIMFKRARWQLFHDETREEDDDARRVSSDSGDSSDDEDVADKMKKASARYARQSTKRGFGFDTYDSDDSEVCTRVLRGMWTMCRVLLFS